MIRIGIAGFGHLGRIHYSVLQELPAEFHIVGIYDHNTDRVQQFQQEEPELRFFSTYADLIAEVDAIAIIASTPAHFELAKAALVANKAIFIEKPMCAHLSQAQELINLWQQNPILFQVGHIERYNPVLRKMLITYGSIDVQTFHSVRRSPFQQRGSDVSVVLDLMIHDIDLLLTYIKSPIKELKVKAKQEKSSFPDEVQADIIFEAGQKARLAVSRLSEKRQRTIELTAKPGVYLLDLLNREIQFTAYLGQNMTTTVLQVNALKEQWLEFYKCYTEHHAPQVGPYEGLIALDLAIQIEQLALADLKENQL
jgi:predicted dehydrogenase